MHAEQTLNCSQPNAQTFHCHSNSGLCTFCLTCVAVIVLRFEILDVQLQEAAILLHLILPTAGS